jgi:phosphate transport system substrate-binding protein
MFERSSMTRRGVLAGAVFAAGFAGAIVPASAAEFSGAGATFPAPVYNAWAAAYRQATSHTLNYQAIGSGAGITQIQNRTVDFGASDAPLAANRLQQQGLVQFPAVVGSLVMVVNLEGVARNQLRLTGDLVADIYLGRIRNWNDPRLVELNPGVTLPNMAIQPIYRSDGSGTTFVFTSYLSLVSPQWNADVRAATSVQWPTGAGARGNDGVAGAVRNTRGAIGYVEYAYAAENNLAYTLLRNADGQFIQASTAAFQAAAAAADWDNSPNLDPTMLNRPGANTWPIVSATFILIPRQPRDPARAREALAFFNWAFGEQGDQIASGLHYVPLPDDVIQRVRAAWRNVQANGQPVFTQ